MSKFRDKMPVFFLGLLFGITIAGGFFVLKLDDYFKNLKLYENVSESISSFTKEQMDKKMAEEIKENNKISDKEKKTTIVSKSNIPLKNNLPLTIDSSDSAANVLGEADSVSIREINSDEIIVKKDELLFSVTVKVHALNIEENKKNDSLLSKVSGVDKEKNKSEFINVQFWQSPLNFKGYKMSKNKLMLYGISNTEEIKLYGMNEFIYMKYQNMVYQLEYTNEFKSYKTTNDSEVITKLK